jgi:hypothetical protein
MKDKSKITNEKPIRIPLDFKEALAALLKTKPEPKEKKKVKKNKKTG